MHLACNIHATSHFAVLCNDCHVQIFTLYFFTCYLCGQLNSPHYLTSYDISYLCHLLPTIYNYFVI